VNSVTIGRPSLGLIVLSTLVFFGCSETDPQEKVAKLRTRYSAKPTGLIVRQQPLEEPDLDADQTHADPETDVVVLDSPTPLRQDILLDVLVRYDASERLPGITLEIGILDPAGNVKDSMRRYVDTAALGRGPGSQFQIILEDVDYIDGDQFTVEIRHPIPLEERDEYQEFSLASSGSG